MSWRADLEAVVAAVPPDQVPDAIGELEAAQARLLSGFFVWPAGVLLDVVRVSMVYSMYGKSPDNQALPDRDPGGHGVDCGSGDRSGLQQARRRDVFVLSGTVEKSRAGAGRRIRKPRRAPRGLRAEAPGGGR